MKKPTGTGKRPESVTRAKAIDKLINEKLATRNINDNDGDEDMDAGLSEDDAAPEDDAEPVRTIVARSDRSTTQQRRRSRNSQVTELSQKLTASLDPETQRLRDEERATRSLQNTQIFTISQQLRDSNTANETLRHENADLRDCLYRVSQQRDRLDVELNFERRMSSLAAQSQNLPQRPGHKYDPSLTRVRGKIRHDEYFSDGGQCTTWITDGSSASDWDHDKENVSSHSSRFHPYTRPVSTWSPRPPSAPRAFRSPSKGFSSPSRRFGFQSPTQSSFHSQNHFNSRSPVRSPVKKGFRPANSQSQNFPSSARCMKPPIVLKPQHRKFSNATPLVGTSNTNASASLPESAPVETSTTVKSIL